jgi:hypothetical protein
MDNSVKLSALGTQDENKQNKKVYNGRGRCNREHWSTVNQNIIDEGYYRSASWAPNYISVILFP